jgi:hypothetical protein
VERADCVRRNRSQGDAFPFRVSTHPSLDRVAECIGECKLANALTAPFRCRATERLEILLTHENPPGLN